MPTTSLVCRIRIPALPTRYQRWRSALLAVGAALFLSASTLCPRAQAADAPEPPLDEITVKGITLQGRVLDRGPDGVRFETIYGEGELLIPNENVEALKIAGQEMPLPGQATPPPEEPENPKENLIAEANPESVDSQLDETKAIQQAWLEQVSHLMGLDRYFHAQEWLDEKLGLRMGTAYTALGLGATDTLSGNAWAASGDFDWFARWKVWGADSGNTGTLGLNLRHRHTYTRQAPSHLSSRVGSVWPVTAGFTDAGPAVTQAYLDQHFLDHNLQFRAGQIFLDMQFDTYSYRSAKLFFLNAAFSDNPAVAFPDYGVGFATLVRPAPDWYFITGAGDAQGRKLEDGVAGVLHNEKLFSGMEVGWAPSTGKLKGHSFAVFGWFAPADSAEGTPDGDGLTVTYEWKPERHYGLFARYSFSGTSATAARHLGTAGMVWTRPFGRKLDRLGAAFGWGAPSDPNADGQGVLEVFYRWQFTPLLQITPDVQLLLTPSYNPDNPIVTIFGVRARLAL